MHKQIYEDYKYVMQDASLLYLGAKFSFEEIVENEDIPFKFRLIVERYFYEAVDPTTTLESHLYFLERKGMLPKIYKQMKAKVKINLIEEKKGWLKAGKKQYTTKVITVDELTDMTTEQKEEKGVVIQELMVGKLALLSF